MMALTDNDLIGAWTLDEMYAEVLLSLLRDDMRKLRIFDPQRGSKLGSWIGMLTTNATHDHLRSAARRPWRERLADADVPLHFRGAPIALVTAGLMALAFMGFTGLAKL